MRETVPLCLRTISTKFSCYSPDVVDVQTMRNYVRSFSGNIIIFGNLEDNEILELRKQRSLYHYQFHSAFSNIPEENNSDRR